MTTMSLDGKAFTYENQLASSEKNKSTREEWFECSCCPPNLTRLFGSLGGYLWHFGGEKGEAYVNVHLYTTARLDFEVDGLPLSLEQKTSWPWEGNILFYLAAPEAVRTTLRLRIPAWAKGGFVLTPSSSSAKIEKGYLKLGPEYLVSHPAFVLHVLAFSPRYVSPHPYTNQNTVSLIRGPIVYCAEDYDNPQEQNHFKNVALKPGTSIVEERREFEKSGELYVALKVSGWERSLKAWQTKTGGEEPGLDVQEMEPLIERELVLIPYYFRANRGGRGHMRVGLLKA